MIRTSLLLVLCSFVFAVQAEILSEKVRIQSDIECHVGGKSMGKSHYDAVIDLKIYVNGNDFWGTGDQKYDYPHPTSTHVRIYNPQNISLKYPAKYAMEFTTFFKVYTGAHWGEGSSIIYFDSFQSFSPVAQSGIIYISKDEKDYCEVDALMLPAY